MDLESNKMRDKTFDAAERGDWKKVKMFIESGGVSVKITRGFMAREETLAHVAVEKGNLDMLKYLIERDSSFVKMGDEHSDLNFHDPQTILETAVLYGHLDIVKYLVENCDDNIFRKRFTVFPPYSSPVCLAAGIGHLDILKYFVQVGPVDVNTGGPKGGAYGVGPLIFTALEYRNITNYLIEEKKADLTVIYRDGQNILYSATFLGDLNFIKYVLDEKKTKIDINSKDANGMTLVQYAVNYAKGSAKKDILQYLVEQKQADINVSREKNNRTLLHDAIFNGPSMIVKYLVDHGADLEKRDTDGATPLNYLVGLQCSNLEMCKYLIEHGANMKQKNNKGETPLDLAITREHISVGKYLIDFLDDIDQRNDKGETLVHLAAIHNNIELLNHLVSKKQAQINIARKNDEWTPLHCAAFWDHRALCEYLIEHGANPQAKDKHGRSPAQVASNDEVINCIQNSLTKIRSRRSLVHSLWIPPHLPQPNIDAHPKVTGNFGEKVANSITYNMQAFHFHSFLAFATFLIRCLFFFENSSQVRGYNFSLRTRTFENGMDNIGEDSVHTFLDFEDEETDT